MKSVKSNIQNNSIDLCKFMMAFVVVAIHTHPFETCTDGRFLNIYGIFVGLAVPFFFLASGYLLAAKMDWPYRTENDLSRICLQLKKIIKMYIIWTIVYFPLAIYHDFIVERMSPVKAILLYIRGFLFIGEQYNSWPLWYLLSTIYALFIILFIFRKCRNLKLLVVISIIASVISISFTYLVNYNGYLPPLLEIFKKLIRYSIANGRILSGLIYIPIGMILSQRKIPNYLNFIVFFTGYIANYLINNSIISSYLLIITSIGLFGIIENITLKDSPMYAKFRIMSTSIYLTHMYIWSFYYKIVYNRKTFGMDSFIVTSVVAIVISLAYIRIRRVKTK